MVELIDNISQFLVTMISGCLSGALYYRTHRQPYFMLACFYGCYALAGLYWTLYYLLFSTTPQIFYVAETGWISGYIFLYLLQYTLSDKKERAFRCHAMWFSPAIGVPLMVFYCTHGDILTTMLMSIMMILISWHAIRGLAYLQKRGDEARNSKYFHTAAICFVAVEYCLWTSSCFWVSDTLSNPYFWFDFLLTATTFLLLPATRKLVGV